MARHNMCFLHGVVKSTPVIQKSEDGELQSAQAEIYTYSDAGLQTPVIFSREPEIISEMESWDKWTLVDIKGPIACKTAKKRSFCPHCAHPNISENSMLFYVNPIFAKKRGTVSGKEKAIEYLKKNAETSNVIYLFGTVCSPPQKIKNYNQFQIALNRKYLIRTDPPEVKADYPWIKSSLPDGIAISDQLYITGFLQTRKIKRKVKCENCGSSYDWDGDKAMEIVPTFIKKLRNEKFGKKEEDEIQ